MTDIRARYERYSGLFGLEVDVTVNRPVGSSPRDKRGKVFRHRKYPVNCGYLTESVLPDGSFRKPVYPEFQYAYILGVDEPVTSFHGRIIAVLHRETDDGTEDMLPPGTLTENDRLIVAPLDREFYEPDIRASVAFAERSRRFRLFCMFEKSCGAVVYTVRDGKLLYLLIRNRSGHIGFPKGHVELGEDERMTMKREISEETALSVEPDLAFREEYQYVLWNIVHKTAVYSLASFRDGETVETMENEIFGDWLLPYPEARRMLSYENDRRILDHADAWLRGKHQI